MDKKPDVFQTQNQGQQNTNNLVNEPQVQNSDPIGNSSVVSNNELNAAEEMKRRTEEQIRLRAHAEKMTASSVADGKTAREELLKEMESKTKVEVTPQQVQDLQAGSMSYEDMAKFQEYTKNLENKTREVEMPKSSVYNSTPQAPTATVVPSTPIVSVVPPVQPPVQPPVNNDGEFGGYKEPTNNERFIEHLSQPQFDAPFDVIPLPSEGKMYKNKKKSVKVAYMTTADENILTSPNLLASGKFLEILINRKLLEPDLRYSDLVEGDRNAIMLWLRATAYGNMYPIEVEDENGELFETDFDLNTIKTINLTVKPDMDGYFDFTLPSSKDEIKFKLLTVGESEHIGELVENEMEVLKLPIDNTSTYVLAKQVVSVNDDDNPELISKFTKYMRIADGRALNEYIESINCGVDLQITVGTPGGGSITTFLPLNLKFFWPNIRV